MQTNPEDRLIPQAAGRGANQIAIVVIIAVIALSIAAYIYFSKDQSTQNEPEPIIVETTLPQEPLPVEADITEPEELTIEEPVQLPEIAPEVEPQPIEPVNPLPPLSDSDQFTKETIESVADGMTFDSYLTDNAVLRKFVVFVDNVAQGELNHKVSPVNGPKDSFNAVEVNNRIYLDPDSYHRYDFYAEFLNQLDEQEIGQALIELKPLINEAFTELGYQDVSFDQRLDNAIEQMLAAPVITGAIELTSVSVNYQFADPELEALPPAQKLMIRMGPENSAKVKAALKRLKAQL
ncbi:DUF3014 domain-containing protein [Paraferrimonas haliotis]|uniref:DUF3014 domain-containing protein n=1 Tax=Paraferrimonas haliotis TaxID=2013866 RepID=A0AA37TUX9_9GAMM|nr:DUF3014 domain-containing protein [Paraferrimonas haliotis]GLS84972.1 hypothetical protein GCM10007894_29490 [Paraferrimonas haliotis]